MSLDESLKLLYDKVVIIIITAEKKAKTLAIIFVLAFIWAPLLLRQLIENVARRLVGNVSTISGKLNLELYLSDVNFP